MSFFDQVLRATDDMEYTTLTVGVVVDAGDPQQMGRLRVRCSAWGENPDMPITDIPWATYVTPFGGSNGGGARGPEINPTNSNTGSVAYGLWAIPKVGANVLVACLDGDPMHRLWLGCIFSQYSPHTMPHGRFNGGENIQGPHSSSGTFIQPYYDNLNIAFNDELDSKEFKTRAADFTVSAVRDRNLGKAETGLADDNEKGHRQGYEISRHESNYNTDYEEDNLDSQTYTLSTPGFHSISLDDRKQNGRIRIRTTSGNQIILDDTNERIYVSTPEGANWIEMDRNGNIDIYSERRISIHSENDLNITSDETIRMYGKKGIHLQTDEELRFRAKKDIVTKTDGNTYEYAKKKIYKESVEDEMHIKTKKDIFIQSQGNVQVTGDKNVAVTASGGSMDLKSSGGMTASASVIHFNGPPATPAVKPVMEEPNDANLPNREPKHEPWPRVMYKKDKADQDQAPEQEVEFEKDSDSCGRVEHGETIPRGENWRR